MCPGWRRAGPFNGEALRNAKLRFAHNLPPPPSPHLSRPSCTARLNHCNGLLRVPQTPLFLFPVYSSHRLTRPVWFCFKTKSESLTCLTKPCCHVPALRWPFPPTRTCFCRSASVSASSILSSFPPQGLCTCWSHFLDCSAPNSSGDQLLQVPMQTPAPTIPLSELVPLITLPCSLLSMACWATSQGVTIYVTFP